MNYLAIDTSGKNLTVIIKKGEEIFAFDDKECGVNHSVELMPKIVELAKKADFNLKDADFFACVLGAGSFTGIRIGVSTIKAMCFAYKKPCLPITSFDTLAYNEHGKVLAVIDAKHNGFYVCGYQDSSVIYPPSYVMRETLIELSNEYQIVASSEIDGFNVKVVSVAQGIINAISSKESEITYDLEALIPLYVRKSQAEEGR
jgi:tRNA threonylcarbamoyl adenosine modification protein YeaZ